MLSSIDGVFSLRVRFSSGNVSGNFLITQMILMKASIAAAIAGDEYLLIPQAAVEGK